MSRLLLVIVFTLGCATDVDREVTEQDAWTADLALGAVPGIDIAAVDAFSGQVIDLEISGTLGEGEPVYVLASTAGEGAGPCPGVLGGQCLDILSPVSPLGSAVADETGLAVVSAEVMAAAGTTMSLQAWAIRGLGGQESLASAPLTLTVQDYILGCMDPEAENYDPGATVDDGGCTYAMAPTLPGFDGDLGPDLSTDGMQQCGGTADVATTGDEFYAMCDAYDRVVFACSTDDDTSAEYISPIFDIGAGQLLSGSCVDWEGGFSDSPGGGKILSVDATDPSCGQYDVFYDMYVDFGGQWGCAGVNDTHTKGGHMWAYVLP